MVMKKGLKVLIIVTLILILTGGFYFGITMLDKDKELYSEFVHDSLKDKKAIYYVDQTKPDGDVYAIADITPDPYECFKIGLYYKVGTDDFILLKEFDTQYGLDILGEFIDDKYYGLNYDSFGSFIILLNKEKSEFKELNFTFDGKKIGPMSMEKIDNKTLRISSILFIDGHNVSKTFKCSIETFMCELMEE